MRRTITRAHATALLAGGVALGAFPLRVRAQANPALKIIAPVAIRAALYDLAALFGRTANGTPAVEYLAGPDIAKAIAGGEAFDVVIAAPALVDDFAKHDYVVGEPLIIGSSVASLAYRHGTIAPSIATPDQLKAVLLAAKSISFSDPAAGGPSSVYFAGVVQRLGISDVVMAKAVLTKVAQGAIPAGAGKVQYAVAQSSEIAQVKGLQYVPIFPADPKSKSYFSAGLGASSADPMTARAFMTFLSSTKAIQTLAAKGIS